MTNDYSLTIKKSIPAPQKQVFEAWLNADAVRKFMMPMEGTTVAKAEFDVRVGGKYLIVMLAGEQEIPIHGEYQTIDPYKQLIFTWLSDFSGDRSVVTLTFDPIGENETELTLTHKGFDSEEQCQNHQSGWTSILDMLANTINAMA